MTSTNAAVSLRRGVDRGPLALAWALVIAFYSWTAVSDNVSWRFGSEQKDYYNLLIDGFLDGQLSLKAEVPRELLSVGDPYDPVQRPSGVGLHDASLYRGKYYIYYGVAPAVTLLLPFRLATGIDLPLKAAVLAVAVAGFTFGTILLVGLQREFFPRAGPWLMAGLIASFGLCSGVALLVRRSSMYELPIASGFCWAMAALFCSWRALKADQRRRFWLMLGGTAWGLAIGSRPTYLLAPAGLLAVAWFSGRKRDRPANLGVALAPLAIIGAALGWYNHARFGNFAEFGVRYILSGVHESKIEHFRPRYVAWNAQAYFVSGSSWRWEFPYFEGRVIDGPRPSQHFGMDIPFGLLPHVPFLLVGAGALLFRGRRWMPTVALVGSVATAPLAVLLMFYAAMVRYIGDFAPTLALLACMGSMAVVTRWRWLGVGVTMVLAFFSSAVSAVFSVRAYSRVSAFNPEAYAALAKWGNVPARLIGRESKEPAFGDPAAIDGNVAVSFRGAEGLVMRVRFAASEPGLREPLLVSGSSGRGNMLAIEHVGPQRIRFVFEHWGRQPYLSPPIPVVFGRDYRLTVSHPLYARTGALARPVGRDDLVISVDGKRTWVVEPLFYPCTPDRLFAGHDPLGFGGFEKRFRGLLELLEP